MAERFWARLQLLIDSSELVIDRPRGRRHPRFSDLVYPLDYGYLEGTSTVDGEGVDAWVGSLHERRLVGLICTVDLERRDAEIKLLVGCTAEEMQLALRFQNQGRMAGILVAREGG